jgi:hypothetical protein
MDSRLRGNDAEPKPRFRIVKDFRNPIVEKYQRFIADHGIGVAGIEFIENAAGEIFTYDVNTNTNYNSDAEAEAGLHGMRAVAKYLGEELARLAAQPKLSRAA